MAKIKIHYKKGGPSQLPALREAMKAPINPQKSLDEVIAELNAFEQNYGITTIEFYARFKRGLMGAVGISSVGLASSRLISI